MALSADRVTQRLTEPSSIQQPVPVAADEVIYVGALVSIQSGLGYAAAESDEGDYALVAMEQVDNTGGADGAVSVLCERMGIFKFPHETADLGRADVNALVYAKDDETVTKTAGTNTPVGRIFKLHEGQTEGSAQYVWVYVKGELS